MNDAPARVRLDKWLWAARLYKTRSLAKQAIEGGKVRYEGQRCKVSKDVEIGATLTVRRGWDEWEIVVQALSDQRRSAPEAQKLYSETPASRERRERAASERQLRSQAGVFETSERPTKKQRRQISRFKQQVDRDEAGG